MHLTPGIRVTDAGIWAGTVFSKCVEKIICMQVLFWVSSVKLYSIVLLHLYLPLYLYCLVRIVDQFTILSGMTELIRRTKLILLIT